MATFEIQGLTPVNSTDYRYFFVKEIQDTLNIDMCNMHCILEVNCDFSTFSKGLCQLGSFTNGSQTGSKYYGLAETQIIQNDGTDSLNFQ